MDSENEAFGLARVRINEIRISEGLLYYVEVFQYQEEIHQLTRLKNTNCGV